MALRLSQSIVRGELDNRERGRVRGSIWLIGRDEPVRLELEGNCLRDLAGCTVRFSNPEARIAPDERTDVLRADQSGVAGEMTVSRKVRVLDVPLEEASRIAKAGGVVPEHKANALYLEWFSERNGRVVIESADFKIDEVSPHAWRLSEKDEEAQTELMRNAMRDWLERLDAHQFSEEEPYDPEQDKPLDEFGYEKFMRESDVRTDKYMELLEKYEGHPDQERIVAREMGWEWIDELLDAQERGAIPPSEPMDLPELVPNPLTEGVDWVRDKDGDIRHPLAKKAFEGAIAIHHYCRDNGLMGEDGDPDMMEVVFKYQTTAAKLAGALNSLAYDDENHSHEGGFVVAALKRALNYLHACMAAAARVAQKKLIDVERQGRLENELFQVREEILALMQKYRAQQ